MRWYKCKKKNNKQRRKMFQIKTINTIQNKMSKSKKKINHQILL